MLAAPGLAGGTGGGASGGVLDADGATHSGTVNTGGGGGGGGFNPNSGTFLAGTGGSGIVILRYAGAQRGSGGTVTNAGGYTIHTFTASGTYTA